MSYKANNCPYFRFVNFPLEVTTKFSIVPMNTSQPTYKCADTFEYVGPTHPDHVGNRYTAQQDSYFMYEKEYVPVYVWAVRGCPSAFLVSETVRLSHNLVNETFAPEAKFNWVCNCSMNTLMRSGCTCRGS